MPLVAPPRHFAAGPRVPHQRTLADRPARARPRTFLAIGRSIGLVGHCLSFRPCQLCQPCSPGWGGIGTKAHGGDQQDRRTGRGASRGTPQARISPSGGRQMSAAEFATVGRMSISPAVSPSRTMCRSDTMALSRCMSLAPAGPKRVARWAVRIRPIRTPPEEHPMRQSLKSPVVGSLFNESVSHGDCQYRDSGACRRR